MAMLPAVNAHSDGNVIVPDEPLSLVPGEKLRVTIERNRDADMYPARRRAGNAKGEVWMSPDFNPFANMSATLMNGDEWDEAVALHIDPLDRVPSDFVRQPGSGAGEIIMTEDFDHSPEGFKESE